jgi:hypothetical protein
MDEDERILYKELSDIKHRLREIEENQIQRNLQVKELEEDVKEFRGNVFKVFWIVITAIASGTVTFITGVFGGN